MVKLGGVSDHSWTSLFLAQDELTVEVVRTTKWTEMD